MVCRTHPLSCAVVQVLFATVIALTFSAGFMPIAVQAQGRSDPSGTVFPAATDIVGGNDADPGEWPWQIRIETSTGFFICGGSIVHPRWILTAAHCVTGGSNSFAPSSLRVVLGDHSRAVIGGTEQIRNVVQIVVHPGWDDITKDNDIALLKLELPAALNDRVKPIPLVQSPADDTLVEPGDIATVTGWGVLSFGGAAPAILQEVEVPIVSNPVCETAYSGLATITANMLCAGYLEGGRDSCQGDSGGPVVVPDGSGGWKQAGIVSFADGCALPGKYGVNARVSRYNDWINQYINSADGPAAIRNPDFELGQNGDWIESSSKGLPLIANTGFTGTPKSGEYLAWLGGAELESSSLSQIVSLSDRASTLQFYYEMGSSLEICDEFEKASWEIGGDTLGSVLLCSENVPTDWQFASYDISAYAGRAVQLAFLANTIEITPSSFFIDDVFVLITPGPSLEVTSLTPASGKPGAVVTVTGNRFADLTKALLGGIPISYSVQSDTTITFTVPQNAESGVIDVTTSYSTANSTESFTVLRPLTVTKDGNGGGTIKANPPGIDCGSNCSEDIAQGDVIPLEATADADSDFIGWSGDCTGNDPTCSVTMDGTKVVTASFALKSYNLNVARTGDGTGSIASSPGSIVCGSDCSAVFEVHTTITLTATPTADSDFTGWSGGCTGASNPCSVSIDATKDVTAAFTLKSYAVTVGKDGDGSGTVASTPAGIDCGQDCAESYKSGTSLELQAQPTIGSQFVGWVGACSGTDSTCTVTVEQDAAISATFGLQMFSLSATTDGDGSGRVVSTPDGIDCGSACEQPFAFGTSITLTAAADEGSTFTGWSGACSGEDLPCVIDIDSATSVIATFAQEEPQGSTLYLPNAINN